MSNSDKPRTSRPGISHTGAPLADGVSQPRRPAGKVRVRFSGAWPKLASKGLLVWLGIGVLAGAAFLNWGTLSPLAGAAAPGTELAQMASSKKPWLAGPESFDKFLASKAAGQISHIGVAPAEGTEQARLLYTLKNGQRHSTGLAAPLDSKGMEDLAAAGASVEVLPGEGLTLSTMVFWGAIALTLGILLAIRRRPATGGLGSFGAVMPGALDFEPTPAIRFSDVIGAEQAKRSLLQVKSFLTDPLAYIEIGAKPYRGILLEGPPGTGKTLLAKAMAGECGANFLSIDGSHFSSSLMGQGIAKVEAVFKKARENPPCIVFIDEFDGVGKRKDGSGAAANDDNRIINRLLVELDGFGANSGVIVLAATNHKDRLDEALLRDGRFDFSVQVQLPTQLERKDLFDMYLGKVRADESLNTTSLARLSSGLSPAAIAGIVNKAAVLAADARAKFVGESHVLQALEDKQMGGEANATNHLTAKTRERIAVHESGHAIVGHKLGKGLVERVSIEPRGSALGVTYITQEHEDSIFEPAELTQRLAMLLAGRQAELITLGNTSSGASDDLKRATELATNMVGRLGFSDKFGLISLAGLTPDLMSPQLRDSLLTEASALLSSAQAMANDCLLAHAKLLRAMTASLLEHETIGPDELQNLFST